MMQRAIQRAMQRAVVSLAVVCVLAACTSDASVGPTAARRPRLAISIGTPPPPPIQGALIGNFHTTGGAKGAAVSPPHGPALDVVKREGGERGGTSNPGTVSHRFLIDETEFNGRLRPPTYWMNFPQQELPPQAVRIGPTPKGQILYANGVSKGSGRIFDFDQANNGFWVIDLTQIRTTGNVFASCTPPMVGCALVSDPVVAVFYHIIGTDNNGNFLFQLLPSAPSILRLDGDLAGKGGG